MEDEDYDDDIDALLQSADNILNGLDADTLNDSHDLPESTQRTGPVPHRQSTLQSHTLIFSNSEDSTESSTSSDNCIESQIMDSVDRLVPSQTLEIEPDHDIPAHVEEVRDIPAHVEEVSDIPAHVEEVEVVDHDELDFLIASLTSNDRHLPNSAPDVDTHTPVVDTHLREPLTPSYYDLPPSVTLPAASTSQRHDPSDFTLHTIDALLAPVMPPQAHRPTVHAPPRSRYLTRSERAARSEHVLRGDSRRGRRRERKPVSHSPSSVTLSVSSRTLGHSAAFIGGKRVRIPRIHASAVEGRGRKGKGKKRPSFSLSQTAPRAPIPRSGHRTRSGPLAGQVESMAARGRLADALTEELNVPVSYSMTHYPSALTDGGTDIDSRIGRIRLFKEFID